MRSITLRAYFIMVLEPRLSLQEFASMKELKLLELVGVRKINITIVCDVIEEKKRDNNDDHDDRDNDKDNDDEYEDEEI